MSYWKIYEMALWKGKSCDKSRFIIYNDNEWFSMSLYVSISFFNPQAIQYSINNLSFCTCYGQAPPCYTYSRSESYFAVETGADDFWHSPKSSCHGYRHWNQHLLTENQDKMHILDCMFHAFCKSNNGLHVIVKILYHNSIQDFCLESKQFKFA